MDDAKKELVQQWLRKAWHDLIAAQALTRREPVVLDSATYHSQQAAEKAVKGLLVFNDHDPDRTHDVERLLEMALPFSHGLEALRSAAQRLTPFATLYRYPSGATDRNPEQAEAALADAADIYCKVLSSLPSEVHPNTRETGANPTAEEAPEA